MGMAIVSKSCHGSTSLYEKLISFLAEGTLSSYGQFYIDQKWEGEQEQGLAQCTDGAFPFSTVRNF